RVLERPRHLHRRARREGETRVAEEEQGMVARAYDVGPRLIEVVEAVAQRRVQELHPRPPTLESLPRRRRKEARGEGRRRNGARCRGNYPPLRGRGRGRGREGGRGRGR